jgi:heat shock protein HslJ
MRAVSLSLAVFAVVLAAGCSGSATGVASQLAGTTWVVERIVNADGTVIRGSGETVTFGTDGTISLASCNLCSGRYALSGSTLRLDEAMACTRRGCPPGTVELERVLNGERHLRRDGEYLVLEGGETVPDAPKVLLLPQ